MRHGILLMGLAMLLAVGLLGCDSQKQQAIDNASSCLKGELEDRRHQSRANTPYLVSRYQEARSFLANEPSLEAPYMVSADLWNTPTDGGMTLFWMEYSSHAAGIVLMETGRRENRQWQLPVLAWEKDLWAQTEGTVLRGTVLRSRRIWLVPTEDNEPRVRNVVRNDGRPPVELLMPRETAAGGPVVGVYDDKGNVSNLVPVFVWRGEPQ